MVGENRNQIEFRLTPPTAVKTVTWMSVISVHNIGCSERHLLFDLLYKKLSEKGHGPQKQYLGSFNTKCLLCLWVQSVMKLVRKKFEPHQNKWNEIGSKSSDNKSRFFKR